MVVTPCKEMSLYGQEVYMVIPTWTGLLPCGKEGHMVVTTWKGMSLGVKEGHMVVTT